MSSIRLWRWTGWHSCWATDDTTGMVTNFAVRLCFRHVFLWFYDCIRLAKATNEADDLDKPERLDRPASWCGRWRTRRPNSCQCIRRLRGASFAITFGCIRLREYDHVSQNRGGMASKGEFSRGRLIVRYLKYEWPPDRHFQPAPLDIGSGPAFVGQC